MGAPRPKEVEGVGSDVEVVAPQDARVRFIIDTMALYVLRDGCEFEQVGWGVGVGVGAGGGLGLGLVLGVWRCWRA